MNAKLSPVTIDGATGALDPHPSKIKLNKLADIRREMASVYRDAKAGKMPIGDATRLAFVLSNLGKLIELETIEQRIDALEAKK